jgi:hypothetical protein
VTFARLLILLFPDLDCVTTNDDARECGTNSTVNFATSRFERYYILLHGASSSSSGDFLLSIEESLHDSCEDALGARDFPFSVRTSLGADGGLIDNAIPPCGSAANVVGRDFWLSVIGRNERLLASTCSSFSDFDTQFSIFTGACGNLSCVAGNDDVSNPNRDCGKTSEGSWFGEVAVSYHILVHCFQGDSGPFHSPLITNVTMVAGLSVYSIHLLKWHHVPCPPNLEPRMLYVETNDGSKTVTGFAFPATLQPLTTAPVWPSQEERLLPRRVLLTIPVALTTIASGLFL